MRKAVPVTEPFELANRLDLPTTMSNDTEGEALAVKTKPTPKLPTEMSTTACDSQRCREFQPPGPTHLFGQYLADLLVRL